ncbi:MAG TPA: hypothetical protein VNS55_00675 [Nocardioides sp.]|nr:hypothetical protein [Nocardioides sp.]
MADDLGRPLRRTDPSVVGNDPFWAVVRERHPDATLVLLPPEPPGPPEHTTSLDDARSAVDNVGRAWTAVAPLLEAYGAAGPPSIGWRGRPGGRALVLEASLVGIGEEAGTEALRAVAARLDSEGWRFWPGTRSGHALLRATDGTARLDAEAGPAATVVTLATAPLRLSEADRSLLRTEARSWV